MKCKNECGTGLAGRKKVFCSDRCRMQHKRAKVEHKANRASPNTEPEHLNPNTPESSVASTGNEAVDYCRSVELELEVREHGAHRTNPDDLNYGPYMTANKLKKAGKRANRVPIPGDSDYEGVCVKIDGRWELAKTA